MPSVPRTSLCLCLGVLLLPGMERAGRLEAQHVIWVDYTTRHFAPQVFNNNDLKNSRGWDDVKARIIHYLATDYANYDVMFVTEKPRTGRYTRLVVGGDALTGGTNVLGTSLPWGVCEASECGERLQATDHGSYRTDKESLAFVFTDNFGGGTLSGTNATPERVSNAIGKTASHELGHIFGLEHWFAVDSYEDGFSLPQTSTQVNSTIQNSSARTPHIMATGLSVATLADSSFRFSPHISNEHLMRNVGTRGYHLPLATLDAPRSGSRATGDLYVGDMTSPSSVMWYASASSGSSFGSPLRLVNDGGDPTDVYLTGDVDGDGDSDLVYGRPSSATTVRWFVRRSTGRGLGSYESWVDDAGDVGDVFRIGDVNGDGRDDLLYGRPATGNHNANAIPLTWYVRLSTGSSFGEYSKWLDSGGYQGHPVFVRDFNRDGKDDLIAARIPTGQYGIWHLHPSSGRSFGSGNRLYSGTGVDTDRFYVDDVSGDGIPDLIIGRRESRNQVRWYVRRGSSRASFEETPHVWIEDAGNSGDIFRIGDATADGRADLVIMRRDQPTGSQVWVSASTGTSFAAPKTWGMNIGQDGMFVY